MSPNTKAMPQSNVPETIRCESYRHALVRSDLLNDQN